MGCGVGADVGCSVSRGVRLVMVGLERGRLVGLAGLMGLMGPVGSVPGLARLR